MEKQLCFTLLVFLHLGLLVAGRGADPGDSDIIQPITPPGTCCQLCVERKRIDRTILYNGIEYQCTATAKLAYCGGECEVASEYFPHACVWSRGNCVYLDNIDSGSTNIVPTVCQIATSQARKIALKCHAKQECCDGKDSEIEAYIFFKEPITCACKETKDIQLPCKPVPNRRHHVFAVNNYLICKDTIERNIPHCSGYCKSNHHFYDLPFPVDFSVDDKKCTCCSKLRTRRIRARVSCYFSGWAVNEGPGRDLLTLDSKDVTVELKDDEGKILTPEEFKGKQGWLVWADITHILSCHCDDVECKDVRKSNSPRVLFISSSRVSFASKALLTVYGTSDKLRG